MESASVVAARLGSDLGWRVEVARDLAGTPVLVDAPGLPPKTTLQTLAFALHGSLVHDGKTVRLERTPADRRLVRAAHVKANRAIIEAGLATWDRILKKSASLGDPAAQATAARKDLTAARLAARAAIADRRPYALPGDLVGEYMVNPGGRLLHGILARLGPDRFANLDPYDERFLSDRPNAVEAILPPINDLEDVYQKEQPVYATKMGIQDFTDRPDKAIVRLNGASSATVTLFDAGGRRVGYGTVNYAMKPLLIGTADPNAPEPHWVDLDADARRAVGRFGVRSQGLPVETPFAKLPEAFLHPERFDPLDYAGRAGILDVPRIKGAVPLVAALNDDLLPLANGCVRGDRIDTALFTHRLLGSQGGFERVTQDGATVLRPIDSLTSVAVDRTVLGREIRRVVSEGRITLANWSSLYAALYPGSPVTGERLDILQDAFPLGYVWQNQLSPGAWALIGAAWATGGRDVPAEAPPFDRLIRVGVTSWLRFGTLPNTSDLNRAPSSVLAALKGARVAPFSSEVVVARRYGSAGEAFLRTGFSGAQAAEPLGEWAASAESVRLKGGDLRRVDAERIALTSLRESKYQIGRRLSLGADVRLQDGRLARVVASDWLTDRVDVTFDALPPAFQEGLLQGVKTALDHPEHFAVPTQDLPGNPGRP